jgi:hypothetical protein
VLCKIGISCKKSSNYLKSQKNSKASRIEGVVALAIGDMAMKKAEIKLNF